MGIMFFYRIRSRYFDLILGVYMIGYISKRIKYDIIKTV